MYLEERLKSETILSDNGGVLQQCVQELRTDPTKAHDYFRVVSELQDADARQGALVSDTPWLAAHAYSILSLIASTSRALEEEVNGKVANLPAIELHKAVGSARLALIGITDWHRQLSRLCRRSSTMLTGQASPSTRPDPGMQYRSKLLDDACAAMVMGMDRLILHARYMEDASIYMHDRTLAAITAPHGPLSHGEGELVHKLLEFFKDVPRTMFEDGLHACEPRDDSASPFEVRLL